jgi:hypothetical protein
VRVTIEMRAARIELERRWVMVSPHCIRLGIVSGSVHHKGTKAQRKSDNGTFTRPNGAQSWQR